MITLKSSVYKESDFEALLAAIRVGKNAICDLYCDKCDHKIACYDLNAFGAYLEEKLGLNHNAYFIRNLTNSKGETK